MQDYIITEKAGRIVAGHRNTGVGTTLSLTESQAKHELRLGTLIPRKPKAVAVATSDVDDAPEISMKLTLAQLQAIAEERKIEVAPGATKRQIIEALGG